MDNHAPSPGDSSTGWREWPETARPQEQPLQTNTKGWGEAARDEPGGAAQPVGSKSGAAGPPAPGWAGSGGVRGSGAGTFSGIPGLAPAHWQALCYVLVIRLQVQLPLHLQGMGLIRGTATATAPLPPTALVTEGGCEGPPEGPPPRGTAPRGMEAPTPGRNGLT